MNRARLVAALVVAMMLLTTPIAAFGEAKTKRSRFKDHIAVVQHRPFLRSGRFELSPRFGLTLNDALLQQFMVGLSMNYHINEDFFVGAIGGWMDFGKDFGGETATYDAVVQATSAIPEISKIQYFAAAEFGWVPLYGKFSLFNAVIVHYDTHITGGVGIVQTASPDPLVMGTFSVGQRYFINDWLCITLEVRDFMYMETLPSGDSFYNVFTFSMGAGIFIPFSFEYTTLK